MKEKIDIIRKEICRILGDLDNSQWFSTELIFDFPPYVSKGWTGSQSFYDEAGNKVRLGLFGDEKFNFNLYKFITEVNQVRLYNRIIFSAKRDLQAAMVINIIYSQEIVDNFNNNLPKSKRGKTIPWWKNPNETKDLV